MITRIRQNPGLLLSFACLALFTFAWVTAQGFPTRAKVFPNYMIPVGLVIVLVQIGLEFWKPIPLEQRSSGADLSADDDYTLREASRLALREYAWIMGLFAGVYLIGAIIPLPIFVSAYARVKGGVRWLTAVLMGLALFALMMGLFERLLRFSWPRGLITEPQAWLLSFLRGLGL